LAKAIFVVISLLSVASLTLGPADARHKRRHKVDQNQISRPDTTQSAKSATQDVDRILDTKLKSICRGC